MKSSQTHHSSYRQGYNCEMNIVTRIEGQDSTHWERGETASVCTTLSKNWNIFLTACEKILHSTSQVPATRATSRRHFFQALWNPSSRTPVLYHLISYNLHAALLLLSRKKLGRNELEETKRNHVKLRLKEKKRKKMFLSHLQLAGISCLNAKKSSIFPFSLVIFLFCMPGAFKKVVAPSREVMVMAMAKKKAGFNLKPLIVLSCLRKWNSLSLKIGRHLCCQTLANPGCSSR